MHIRSQLARYRASGMPPKDPNSAKTPERVFWDIWLIPNRKEDRRNWLQMAHMGGFTDIQLTRYKSDSSGFTTQEAKKPQNRTKLRNTPEGILLANAEIGRQGLEMLDAIIAARKAKAGKSLQS